MWKKSAFIFLGICTGSLFVFFFSRIFQSRTFLTSATNQPIQYTHRIYDPVSFETLSTTPFYPQPFSELKKLEVTEKYRSSIVSFPTISGNVSAVLYVPQGKGPFPVIVLLRGYVDKDKYVSGTGTKRAAMYFAEKGYLTISPDFLGFGLSDPEPNDTMMARFEKPRTVLQLLASLSSIELADPKNVGIWAHSNGGQIAISVLEISKQAYPTTLWAPVSEAFPQSILQYVDELDDKGAYLKSELEKFALTYTYEDFDIGAHLDSIQTNLQVHQGVEDEEVPVNWSDTFVKNMKDRTQKVEYYTYPRENHNFTRGSVNTLLERDLIFFERNLRK
ncbi:MAG: putative peptidase [Microgenomates group bacterium GW2011_GWF2_45_18]|nr:MAG: putative peptidase [Microgenomates group bacterium GW2011_GWF1_44_10]KKU01489.1 MAG: putative peptidase [Microgenomates group bacterium GW2011_GWF2_45_18]OGJ40579.1 MAG: hypothetical protein A2378_01845 [Candidatus Pacebacteria bacterium RIFOXYB1_FULL_44_10]HAU99398.1 hypothetical protein [Candidatus Paceibacterota bacterium]HAX01597.1 hypothetical protein [Candidatus Paceibacterota bacterium]